LAATNRGSISLPSVGFSISFVGAFFRQGDRKLLLRVSHE
jgi:hypothetical protein